VCTKSDELNDNINYILKRCYFLHQNLFKTYLMLTIKNQKILNFDTMYLAATKPESNTHLKLRLL